MQAKIIVYGGEWRNKCVTEKQMKLIKSIEEHLVFWRDGRETRIVFGGKTRGEACDFIDRYLEEAQRISHEMDDEFFSIGEYLNGG